VLNIFATQRGEDGGWGNGQSLAKVSCKKEFVVYMYSIGVCLPSCTR